jgi:hypothetical protein
VSINHWPDTNRVTHGGFTLDLARAAIRNITYDGAQIIDLLYTAIRPLDWSTLSPDEHSEDTQIIGNDCVITITDVFTEGEFLDVRAVTRGKGIQGPEPLPRQ